MEVIKKNLKASTEIEKEKNKKNNRINQKGGLKLLTIHYKESIYK